MFLGMYQSDKFRKMSRVHFDRQLFRGEEQKDDTAGLCTIGDNIESLLYHVFVNSIQKRALWRTCQNTYCKPVVHHAPSFSLLIYM